jgi:hypothetical protein
MVDLHLVGGLLVCGVAAAEGGFRVLVFSFGCAFGLFSTSMRLGF